MLSAPCVRGFQTPFCLFACFAAALLLRVLCFIFVVVISVVCALIAAGHLPTHSLWNDLTKEKKIIKTLFFSLSLAFSLTPTGKRASRDSFFQLLLLHNLCALFRPTTLFGCCCFLSIWLLLTLESSSDETRDPSRPPNLPATFAAALLPLFLTNLLLPHTRMTAIASCSSLSALALGFGGALQLQHIFFSAGPSQVEKTRSTEPPG